MPLQRTKNAALGALKAVGGAGVIADIIASGDGLSLMGLLILPTGIIAARGVRNLQPLLRGTRTGDFNEDMAAALLGELGEITAIRVKREANRYLLHVEAGKIADWRGIPNDAASLTAVAKLIEMAGYGNANLVLKHLQGLKAGTTTSFTRRR